MWWMSFKVEDHYDLRKHLHVDYNMNFYEERKSSCDENHSELKTSTTWENTSTLWYVINMETVCLFLWYFGSTSKHYSFRDPFQLLYLFWTYFVISIGIIPFLLAKRVKLIRSDTFSISCIYKCFVK